MKKDVIFLFFCFFLLRVTAPLCADNNLNTKNISKKQVAMVTMGSTVVYFTPAISHFGSELRVAPSQGTVFSRHFSPAESPEYRLQADSPDGIYTYELRLITVKPRIKKRPRTPDQQAENPAENRVEAQPAVQSGYFTVKKGVIVVPGKNESLSSPLDIVHSDDVIIDGSLCVGNDCYSGLSFGFDTQVYMENNLRLFFDDTSSTQNYPRNDWRLIFNDSTDGGGNYFAVEDATEAKKIFSLEAGAPENSLYVDSHGDVGINTSTPYYELHITDGDSPAIRLEQDGSYGWTPQKWDLCGNESNFFIRDATHASKLPFRIEPDTPTDTLHLSSDGKVGMGTGYPEFSLEVQTTGEHAMFVLQRTDGAEFKLSALANKVQIGARSNHEVRFTTNNEARMTISAAGNVGIGNTAPGHMFVVGTSGAYCNGGAWVDGSSRAFKENIRELSEADALNALDELKPVRYNYRADRSEEYLGFIAEDVPELVAMKDRRGMTAMDVVAVLTRVVQNQNRTMKQQNRQLQSQQQELKAQRISIKRLSEKIVRLEKKSQ